MRRMSVFPQHGTALGNLGRTANEIRQEAENSKSELVSDLVNLSAGARFQAIRSLPMPFNERKTVRNRVNSVKLSKTILTADCRQQVSRSFRRFCASLASAMQHLIIWQDTLKEIGGRFGTSVLSYFLFLKWLLQFNLFSLIINFCFITIPQIVHAPNISSTTGFRGLELLTGVGYFNQTVLFYGGYNGEVIVSKPAYNMQLAYFFTIATYLVLCWVSLIYSMSRSFQKNFVLETGPVSGGAWRLLCSWDFSVVNEKAIQYNKNNLAIQLKESLSERLQEKNKMSLSDRIKHLSLHLLAWLLSLGLALGSCAGIYFLGTDPDLVSSFTVWYHSHFACISHSCAYVLLQAFSFNHNPNDLRAEASTLLLPVVVSLINLIVPLLYSLISKIESYPNPRTKIYISIIRNVILKMSVLGILCFYWLNFVPDNISCWETFVGQSVYRLLIIDFIFCLLGIFFGEFLRNVIGTMWIQSLGVPEFDIARNVLDLIYAQTLAWIGIYFSPLLPVMQVLKLFIIFYLKKVSLSMNCQPPKHTGRAAQIQTVFIALLFFPSFVGVLSMVAYTVWSLKPSDQCGPFQGLDTPFQTIFNWTDSIQNFPKGNWVWWIFENILRSELFYYLISLIVLVITYFLWQITQGRKQLIKTLREQIVNEGKDKAFLLNKLQNLQKERREIASYRPQDFDQTPHFNPNWTNTLPLDM
ncbi:transmembrane channel-like protein 5 isoform X1 [Carassius carassius]|uniref:transmembrane channel-like protein 5 isoform X1 n=1 Tax=Carassius carassius TaxID=217509 RepID=UPI002868C731|nr:transmembrane channel-like protein 5 isoform X1 [Carassius carassius]XP_059413261.1 transmembrane channel-like protein 5 isoform X1 [Carassius carassius]XP_059413262.1 transmembrane channel-like protein 5 isoform X1 [Carassius carassius]XP_059413264.1 transmembrane channel-like protein 5 isoform X1 [Carassius carassius]